MYTVTRFLIRKRSDFPRRDAPASAGTEGYKPVAGPWGFRPATALAGTALSSLLPLAKCSDPKLTSGEVGGSGEDQEPVEGRRRGQEKGINQNSYSSSVPSLNNSI